MDIQSVNIWKNGKSYKANEFVLWSITDDLKSKAVFCYELRIKEIINGDIVTPADVLTSGNLTLEGESYTAWTGSNVDAYTWAAKELNLKPIV
jgi:hypothetical protein